LDTSELSARFALGLITSEDLIAWGIDAIAGGCESPAVLKLAVSSPADTPEPRVLFERALSQLHQSIPTPSEAIRVVANRVIAEIADGQKDPIAGAMEVWDLTLIAAGETFPEFGPLIYVAMEAPDRPEDAVFFRDAAVSEARRIVSRR
jgi:hypothetical protein